MAEVCDQAISEYLATLKGGFDAFQSEDGCVLVTPFLRPDNEAIELSLSMLPDGTIDISDNAETLDYLFINGANITSRRLRDRLNVIAHRFAVELEDDQIRTRARAVDLGDKLQAVLGAVQDVTYFIYNRAKGGPSTFDERVERMLIEQDVRYQQAVTIKGEKGVHSFRFYIDNRHHLPIQPISTKRPTIARQKAEQLAYHVLDIKLASGQYSFMAVL